ncbi:MAG: protein-L-isoaspartate(D-aspartate) O-methyltransferase [Alphaproteobacteria bacterium]|nr:protein-L-isoaspartate(D-aspartate) O-methyltransferase [Alphaproteobacteria bacterium]
MRQRPLITLLCLGALWTVPAIADDGWAEARALMVRIIERHADSLAPSAELISPAVLAVMNTVPRHRFVPEAYQREAYADTPLPIGHGQTISQPFIVALMTELLGVGPEATVLEIGTGSGYQAAVLSPLVTEVCTLEIIAPLGETAAARLASLGYDNVRTRIGDGYFGWPECGPFDGITVTAAAGHVPPPLVQQLKPGGRMVIPVGDVYGPQYLTLVEKDTDGAVTTRQLLAVRFVPLTRARE